MIANNSHLSSLAFQNQNKKPLFLLKKPQIRVNQKRLLLLRFLLCVTSMRTQTSAWRYYKKRFIIKIKRKIASGHIKI